MDAGVPYLYYTAHEARRRWKPCAGFTRSCGNPRYREALARFPVRPRAGWPGAFRALAAALPDAHRIVVLDEYPLAGEQDTIFDGALQAAWDRLLSPRPVLLLAARQRRAHDRPANGPGERVVRARRQPVLGPLNPAESARPCPSVPLTR